MSARLLDSDPREASLDRLALIVSALASPFVVLPIFLVALALHFAPSFALALIWSALAIAGMVAVPAGYVVLMVRRGSVTDVHVRLREQRRGPFVAAIAGCAVACLLLAACGAAPAMILAAAAAVVNGLAFLAVTLRWKISMHPSTLTACALMAGRLVHPLWLAALLAVPAVMWARVRRGRHTWSQGALAVLLAGAITAFFVETYLARGGAVLS